MAWRNVRIKWFNKQNDVEYGWTWREGLLWQNNKSKDTLESDSMQDTNHNLIATGLDIIWDALNEAKKLLSGNKEVIKALNKLYPNRRRKWCIVFIIPTRMRDSWKCPQSIDFEESTIRLAWDEYLEQYVMMLNDHRDLGTRQFILAFSGLIPFYSRNLPIHLSPRYVPLCYYILSFLIPVR